jgi:DNA-binding NarL/FixJ family response regulator
MTTSHSNPLILIVEDAYLVGLQLKADLESVGAEVVGPAPTVSKALELLERHSITCAILDVNLATRIPPRSHRSCETVTSRFCSSPDTAHQTSPRMNSPIQLFSASLSGPVRSAMGLQRSEPSCPHAPLEQHRL